LPRGPPAWRNDKKYYLTIHAGITPATNSFFSSIFSSLLRLRMNEEWDQPRSHAQTPGGLSQGPRIGRHDAGGLEGSDAAGAKRMDLLGHLGQTSNDAQPTNPARGRGTPGGQTPPLLLAGLSASPNQRKEVVLETSARTTRHWQAYGIWFAVATFVPAPADIHRLWQV
jgi:hypothetical protein